MDIKDLGITCNNTPRRLVANLPNKTRSRRQWPSNGKWLLCKAIELHIIIRSLTSMLKVLAMKILAMKVANTDGGSKGKVKVVADVGRHNLGPEMAIVPLVHAEHGFGIGMRCGSTHGWKEKEDITIICWRQKLNLYYLNFVIIYLFEYILAASKDSAMHWNCLETEASSKLEGGGHDQD